MSILGRRWELACGAELSSIADAPFEHFASCIPLDRKELFQQYGDDFPRAVECPLIATHYAPTTSRAGVLRFEVLLPAIPGIRHRYSKLLASLTYTLEDEKVTHLDADSAYSKLNHSLNSRLDACYTCLLAYLAATQALSTL